MTTTRTHDLLVSYWDYVSFFIYQPMMVAVKLTGGLKNVKPILQFVYKYIKAD